RVFNQQREAFTGRTHHSLIGHQRADRADRTGQQRLIGLVALGPGLRLAIDGRVLAVLDERLRCQLPAGVAVDARGVHKEVAIEIRREPFGDISHSVSPLCDRRTPRLSLYHTYSTNRDKSSFISCQSVTRPWRCTKSAIRGNAVGQSLQPAHFAAR